MDAPNPHDVPPAAGGLVVPRDGPAAAGPVQHPLRGFLGPTDTAKAAAPPVYQHPHRGHRHPEPAELVAPTTQQAAPPPHAIPPQAPAQAGPAPAAITPTGTIPPQPRPLTA